MRVKLSDQLKNKLMDHLHDEAIKAGIPLKESDNLYSLAYKAVTKTEVGRDLLRGIRKGGVTFDELVHMVITKLIVPKTKKPVNSLNEKYVKDYMIPNLVLNLKKDKYSLDEIKSKKNLQKLMSDFKVKSDLIERVWNGEKKPLRQISHHDEKFLNGLYETKQVPEVFSKFIEGKGADEIDRLSFISYWTTSVKNQARDFWKSIKKVEQFDEAKYFGEVDDENLRPEEVSESEIRGGDWSRLNPSHPEMGADDTSLEDKLDKKTLYRQLSSINPKYESLLDNMLEGKSQAELKKSMGIESSSDLKKLLQDFSKDLAKIIRSMGMNQEETIRVLRAKKRAKIASSILGRIFDVSVL